MEASINDRARLAPNRDISGYRIFSAGDLGEAHALAHQALDLGQKELGYHQLGTWLSQRHGEGSQWVHLQWHMMVFELGVGRWHDAHARFMTHIDPVSASSEALTDAPAGLWLLRLAGDERVELPWEPARRAALDHLGSSQDPFLVLHHLLALAGAGDRASIRAWLDLGRFPCGVEPCLQGMAHALLAYAAGDYVGALQKLAVELPRLSTLGGSHAQGELFRELYRVALAKSVGRSRLDAGAIDEVVPASISTN